MRFEFKPAYLRLLEGMGARGRQERVKAATGSLMQALDSHATIPPGLGLKRLRGGFWEIRAGLNDRVVFHWRKDRVEFVLAGDHEAVRRFLKSRP